MRTRVKICCLASVEEAERAVAAGADAVGMVAVQPPSPRTISDALIARIAATVPSSMTSVLLSTGRTADAIAAQVVRTGVRAVQLVLPLDPAESERLAGLLPALKRIQVVHVEGPEVLTLIPERAPHADAFLLDSGKPNAATPAYGGTGQVHDWSISAAFVRASPIPVWLAGGLTPDNVADAIRQVRPYGVDLCTGLRTDRRLDPGKVDAFMTAVRQADADMAV